MQRRTPVSEIATDLGDEGRISRRIELHLEKRGPCIVGIVLVAIRNAWTAHETRIGIAERHREPESNKVFKRLCRGQRPLTRQREFPLDVVTRMRNCRDEADARLVMSYIMTVIIAPLAVLAVKVSANILWSERLLN